MGLNMINRALLALVMRADPRAVLVVGLLAVAAIVAPTPVPAAASYSNCIINDLVCLYDGTGGNGAIIEAIGQNPGTCYTLPVEDRNRVESFYNSFNDSHHVQFYDLPNCTGTELRRAYSNALGPHAAGVMDSFSSSFGHRNRVDSMWRNSG